MLRVYPIQKKSCNLVTVVLPPEFDFFSVFHSACSFLLKYLRKHNILFILQVKK